MHGGVAIESSCAGSTRASIKPHQFDRMRWIARSNPIGADLKWMHRPGRLSLETLASRAPQDEAEFAQNPFLTLRSARRRASRRARPGRRDCDQFVVLAPMASSPAMRALPPDLPAWVTA